MDFYGEKGRPLLGRLQNLSKHKGYKVTTGVLGWGAGPETLKRYILNIPLSLHFPSSVASFGNLSARTVTSGPENGC